MEIPNVVVSGELGICWALPRGCSTLLSNLSATRDLTHKLFFYFFIFK